MWHYVNVYRTILIYGFSPVQCSGDIIALNLRMFIALVFIYKFVVVGTIFRITREFVVLPTPFYGAKSLLSHNNLNLHPVLPDFVLSYL